MSDPLSRRQLFRTATGIAVLGPIAAGCSRRISAAREIALPCPSDLRLSISPQTAPELFQKGGAVLVRVAVNGVERPLLVANAGNGFVSVDGRCTHESCPLTWVQEDREVECPCHGSRFASDGTVLNAPAVVPLGAYSASLDPSGNVVVSLAPGDGVFPPVQGGKLVVDPTAYPALATPGGAVLGHAEGHAGPIIVARTNQGDIVALDGTCTHQGCTVHPAQTGLLHCPCHGSKFAVSPDLSDPQNPHPDPGWVLAGPAATPLGRFTTAPSPDGKTAIVTFPASCL
jgi:Rieske Fe-S protein